MDTLSQTFQRHSTQIKQFFVFFLMGFDPAKCESRYHSAYTSLNVHYMTYHSWVLKISMTRYLTQAIKWNHSMVAASLHNRLHRHGYLCEYRFFYLEIHIK